MFDSDEGFPIATFTFEPLRAVPLKPARVLVLAINELVLRNRFELLTALMKTPFPALLLAAIEAGPVVGVTLALSRSIRSPSNPLLFATRAPDRSMLFMVTFVRSMLIPFPVFPEELLPANRKPSAVGLTSAGF